MNRKNIIDIPFNSYLKNGPESPLEEAPRPFAGQPTYFIHDKADLVEIGTLTTGKEKILQRRQADFIYGLSINSMKENDPTLNTIFTCSIIIEQEYPVNNPCGETSLLMLDKS